MQTKRKTHFLLVEDDPNDVYLARRALRCDHSCSVEVVCDAQEAIEYLMGLPPFSDYPPRMPDVILLDLKMPRMSGFDFLEWLRKEAPDHLRLCPVVVISSSNLQQDVHRAYELGANTFMVKPIDAHLFEERLKALGILWSAHAEIPH